VKKPRTLLIATALLCVSCGQTGSTGADQPRSTPSSTASALVSLSADGGPQAPGPTEAARGIAWDQSSKDEAVLLAEQAMADFARPDVSDRQWANDLARWLTPQATADYSAVDPANIPATRVTGPATLRVDEANGYGVIAEVPTDAGTYTLQILRTDREAPWKVNRITPPGS